MRGGSYLMQQNALPEATKRKKQTRVMVPYFLFWNGKQENNNNNSNKQPEDGLNSP